MGETRKAIDVGHATWEELTSAIEYAVKALDARLNRHVQSGLCEVTLGENRAEILLPMSALASSQSLRVEVRSGEMFTSLKSGGHGRPSIFGPWIQRRRLQHFLYDVEQALTGKRTPIAPVLLQKSFTGTSGTIVGATVLVVFGGLSVFGTKAVQNEGGLAEWAAWLFCLVGMLSGLVWVLKAILSKR
jgi:hypothetical protein